VGRAFRLTAPVVREHPRQVAIANVLTKEIARAGHVSRDGVVWFCIDIADYGGGVPAARTGRGIIAGIFDLFVLWRGRVCMIEIKADDGQLTGSQRSMAASCIAAGVNVGVARDWIEVLACLDEWGVPRKRSINEVTA
jgi:hypothetical protein